VLPPETGEWDGVTLVDQLLAEQQRLTAVERFAQKHARTDFPVQSRYYRDLVPLDRPAPGQQYAFEVDLDSCSSCKACVSACHSLNGLEENETWREVGFVIGKAPGVVLQQAVTTACHHCVEPGCLQGCPVAAYDKDPVTGIVRHLDDQCIGCQYCTMKCPYDVPKYSERLGIVRKCDMCHGRLAAGEAPACVQACPHEAIRISVVSVPAVRAEAGAGARLVPGAFDSGYTVPTTRYRSRRGALDGAQPADSHRLHLEPAHGPLMVMLVLTQGSAGMLAFLAAADAAAPRLTARAEFPVLVGALAVLLLGLAASTLHLGRPLGAWRFFLGLRTSWMSREILAFGLLAAAAAGATAAAGLAPASPLARAAVVAAALLGAAAVFTSVMIYVDTRRALWRLGPTLRRFFGTFTSVGLLAAGLVGFWFGAPPPAAAGPLLRGLAVASLALAAAIHGGELLGWRRALRDPANPAHASAVVVRRHLRGLSRARVAVGGVSALLMVVSLGTAGGPAAAWLAGALLGTLVGAVLERYVFFTAVVAYRMPGGV